jgi:hypothetical protein
MNESAGARGTAGLRALALVSGVYDLLISLPMLFMASTMARLFGSPPPVPPLNAELNGVFTLTLGVGYFWAAARPYERRGYLWVAGVLAKGLGAALFVVDHVARSSPAPFLLFALTDGALAVVSAWLLLRARD